MRDIEFNDFLETTNKSVNDIITEFKKKDGFKCYKENIKSKNANYKFLGSLVFLETLNDVKFDALTHNLAYEMLFKEMDKLLKAELLESED